MESQKLAGGNTADMVALIHAYVPFVVKIDRNQKLAKEGLAIQHIKNNLSLPKVFRDAWPEVFAVRNEPPYAYMMEYFSREDGWRSLEDILYPPETPAVTVSEALRLGHRVLDLLFGGYNGGLNERHRPSITADYWGRIRERLEAAAQLDAQFISRPLTINGLRYEGWRDYLAEINRQSIKLEAIAPPFVTVVHGDPNPGNLMLRGDTRWVEIKILDPKEWETGDYLFDIAKLTHFLSVTGPVEKPANGKPVKALLNADGVFGYEYSPPAWTEYLIEAALERTQQFAEQHEDRHWRTRYELAMAANLLGLPAGRLSKGKVDAALILYAEGLKWLHQFCSALSRI